MYIFVGNAHSKIGRRCLNMLILNRSFIQIFGIKRQHRCMFELPTFECYPPTHSNIGHSKIGGRISVAKVAEVSLFQFAKAPTKMYDYMLHRKVRWNLSVHVSLNYIFFVPFRTWVFEVADAKSTPC